MEIEKIKELEQIENEFKNVDERIDSSYLDDYTSKIDITRMYLKEICKYPLLTIEEEFEIGQNLKLVDNLKVATKKCGVGIGKIFEINLNMIFKLLDNNNSYKEIIESLLSYYKIKSADKLIYDKLKKYDEISKILNRPLNSIELEKYFNIKEDNYEILSEKELVEQINDYLCYKRSFDTMFNSNLRLVVSVAKKYHRENLEILDLISEGNLGLIKAIGYFDSSLGFKFSTYAIWQIRRSIQSFVSFETNKLKMPENLSNSIIKLKREITRLEQEYQRKLSLEEISKELNMPVSKISEYLNCKYDLVSIDQPVGDEDTTLEEFIPTKEEVEKDVMYNSLKEDIEQLYVTLTEQELDVIKMRYGLGEYNGKIYSLREIGEKYEVTHQRVNQIQDRALRKMKILVRHDRNCGSLEDYL